MAVQVPCDGYFIGRSREIERIVEGASRSSAIVVYGLGGIGKSELAHYAAALLRRRDGWGGAAIVTIALDARFADGVEALLRTRLAAGPTRGDRDDDREQVVASLETRPTILILENAHVAAPAVSALIDAVMRRVTRSLVLVTSRVELDLATAPVIVRLGPLSEEEARELVRRLSERLAIDALDEEGVILRAGGSPFHLRALLGGWYQVKADGVDPLRDGLAALPDDERAALARIVAVARCPVGGSAFDAVVEPEMLGRLRRRFLVGAERGRAVVHDLVREAALAAFGPEEMREARREAARIARTAFATSRDPLHAIETICLLAMAGDHASADERLDATYRSIAAAGLDHLLVPSLETLAAAGSTRGFLLHARVMLRMARIDDADSMLARRADDPALARLWQYHALRGIAAQRRGNLAAARVHFGAARDAAPTGWLRARMSIHLADVLALAGEGDAARGVLAEIEGAAATDLRDLDRARVRWSEALSFALEQRWSETRDRVALGRDLAASAGSHDMLRLLGMLDIVACVERGDVAQARRVLDELTTLQDGGGLREEIAQFYRGAVLLASGEVGVAVETLRRAYDFSRRHRDEVLGCLSGHYLGRALLARGDAAEAHAILEETTNRAAVAGLGTLVDTGRVYVARAAVTLGRVREAIDLATRLRAHPWPFVRAAAMTVEAYAVAMAGDLAVARQFVRTALADAGDREPLRTDVLVDLAEIESFGGDPAVVITTGRAARLRQATSGRRYYEARALAALIAGLVARGTSDDLALASRELDALERLARESSIEHLVARANLLRSVLDARAPDRRGHGPMLAAIAPGPEPLPGVVAYLRFVGALAPRLWITCSDGSGRFGDDETVAATRATCDLLVDTVAASIASRHSAHEIRNRASIIDLIAYLVRQSRVPVTAEALYRAVWNAEDYHPLRHRNTLYMALNRARRALAEVLPGREVITRVRDGWTIAPDLLVCVVSAAPGGDAPASPVASVG